MEVTLQRQISTYRLFGISRKEITQKQTDTRAGQEVFPPVRRSGLTVKDKKGRYRHSNGPTCDFEDSRHHDFRADT